MPILINLDLDRGNYEAALDQLIGLTGQTGEETVTLRYKGDQATFFVRKLDLYVVAYQAGGNRKNITNENYSAHTAPNNIDQAAIVNCISSANRGDLRNESFVTAAFVISEAARFMTARVALYAALKLRLPGDAPAGFTDESIRAYKNHTPVLNNWDKIKTHAHVTNTVLRYPQIHAYFTDPDNAGEMANDEVKTRLRNLGIQIA